MARALTLLKAWDGLDLASAAAAVDSCITVAARAAATPDAVEALAAAGGTPGLMRLAGLGRITVLSLVGHSLRAQSEGDFELAGRFDLLTEQLDAAMTTLSRVMQVVVPRAASAV